MTDKTSKRATTVTERSTVSKVAAGHQLSLVATVRSRVGRPSGRVTFTDSTTRQVLGVRRINKHGVAELKTRLATGMQHVVAGYSGDHVHAASRSKSVRIRVVADTLATSNTTLAVSPTPAYNGELVTLTAQVNYGYYPLTTGSVTFTDLTTGATLATAPLNRSDEAQIATSALSPGDHELTAEYSGNASWSVSTSPQFDEPVIDTPNPTSSITAITTSTSSSVYDNPVTLSVDVAGGDGVATGYVTFTDANGSTLAVQRLISGAASFTTRALAVGSRSITATYSGDQTYASSTSTAATIAVTAQPGGISDSLATDSFNDGDVPDAGLSTTRLHQAWSTKVAPAAGSDTVNPLVADGRVFLIVYNGVYDGTPQLEALDALTGAVDWKTAASRNNPWRFLAYDGGQLFAVATNGIYAAFDAATGEMNWSASQSQLDIDAPPTAYDGVLYIVGTEAGGTLSAARESDGVIEWDQAVENGDFAEPAVDDSGVYVSYACGLYYGFSLTGQPMWFDPGGCEGGGGATSVVHDSAVYARDGNSNDPGEILSEADGSLTGTFYSTDQTPSFDSSHMYLMESSGLTAVSPSGSPNIWTFPVSGWFTTPALVVNGTVYGGTNSNTLYGVSASTGTQQWSVVLPTTQYDVDPDLALAAGSNELVATLDGSVTAFSD